MDGACRDVEEIRELGFPLYCAGVVPAGPHKGHGGVIDDVIALGGVAVAPGDLVIGDDDGVTIVPLRQAAHVMEAATTHMRKEEEWLTLVDGGSSMAKILGLTVEEIA
jgi:regulator of RNase E activity RraA